MKKIIGLVLLVTINLAALAQYEKEDGSDRQKGFKKENLFTGGSVTASFFRGGTVLGISPYFGYSVNRFIDVAISANINYSSQRDNSVFGDKLRQTVYGPGAFVRLFPVNFIFAQAQYEHNFIKLKYIPASGSSQPTDKYKADANSLLVGGGYCSGRQGTGSPYYYFSVLWDVSRVAASPYVDQLNRAVPVIRAGFNIPLFQGKR